MEKKNRNEQYSVCVPGDRRQARTGVPSGERSGGRRFLSCVLILSMVLGMFPFGTVQTAAAEELPEETAVTEVSGTEPAAEAADGEAVSGTELPETESTEPTAQALTGEEAAAAADGGTEQTATEAGEPAAEETPAAAETPAPTQTPAPVTLNLGNTFDLSEGVLLSEVLEELKLPVTLKEISKVVLEDDIDGQSVRELLKAEWLKTEAPEEGKEPEPQDCLFTVLKDFQEVHVALCTEDARYELHLTNGRLPAAEAEEPADPEP
ncbi:MAG: hypothetical protein K6C08_00170, partial [Oscillospiraceae bacterium]|nr:hypothetical protein [Oscillospiraceae bacterium]